jgi:hypothetical protein
MPRLRFSVLLVPLALAPAAAVAQDATGDSDLQRALARSSRLLLREELRGNCAGLTVTTKTHIDRLRELQKSANKENEGPPVSLMGERPAAADFARERDRVEALNVVLDAKGCMPVNIEEELKKTPPSPPAGKSKTPTMAR